MSLPRNLLPLGRDFGFGNCDQTPREFSHLLKRRRAGLLAGRACRHGRFLRPRSRWRPLLASRRSRAQVGADQVAVGEALVHDGPQHVHKPASIIKAPVIEPMDLFGKVRGNVERVNAHVGAFDGALQERPEVFEAVGVNLPLHISDGMVNDAMSVVGFEALVRPERVGMECGPGLHLGANLLLQVLLADAAHDRRGDARMLAVLPSLQEAEHGDLIHAASPTDDTLLLGEVHELGRATEEALIRFDVPAHLAEGATLHGEADTVKHEPRGFLCDPHAPRQFVGADAVLRVRQHPQRGKPLVETDGAVLEDRAEFHRELPPTIAALPNPPSLEKAGILRVARGAEHAMRPAQRDQEGERDIGVREVADCVVQGVGEVQGLRHGQKVAKGAWCVKYVSALVRRQLLRIRIHYRIWREPATGDL